MAGVRQFDEEAVMDAAVEIFWRQGYGETTMADLAKSAGVQRGSLYHAYGDKEALLLRALDHYAARYGDIARAALQEPNPRRAIEGFLDSHLARMADLANPAGCLMCQTALECGGRDPAPSALVREQFLRTEAALQAVLERGREDGLLSASTDSRALARFFLGVSRGMAVLHRAYGELEPVQDMAKTALSVLDGATQA